MSPNLLQVASEGGGGPTAGASKRKKDVTVSIPAQPVNAPNCSIGDGENAGPVAPLVAAGEESGLARFRGRPEGPK